MSDDTIIINNQTVNESLTVNNPTVAETVITINQAGNLVFSVNDKTGFVVITKADIGLSEVDNTSDANKPLSNAELIALMSKVDLSAFNILNNYVTSHYQSWNNVVAYLNNSSFLNLSGGTITGTGNEEYTLKIKGGSTGDQLAIATDGVAGYGVHLDVLNSYGNQYQKFGIVASNFYVNTVNGTNSFNLDNSGNASLVGNLSSKNIIVNNGNSNNWNTAYYSLSSLTYSNIQVPSNYYSLEDFLNQNTLNTNKGSTVTLSDGRVYILAGNNPNDYSQYLEINTNPIQPIYELISLYNSSSAIVDRFSLTEYKSAKYTLQIETDFNNEIYYSEINVLGSVSQQSATACEYGQMSSSNLISGYVAKFNINEVQLIVLFDPSNTPGRNLLVRGHRTNFFKI